MAKKGRKQTKQESSKTDEPVVDNNEDVDVDEPEADDASDAKTPKRGTKRASTVKNESPAKKKKEKVEENGVASTRPKRATASKAAKEVKSLLQPRKRSVKKGVKKAPSPRKEPSQFEVESIIDSRKRKGRTEFKIRWKGYTASSDTWEPARNLNCPEILDAWKADNEKAKVE